jgi:2-furoate---CoA ligase
VVDATISSTFSGYLDRPDTTQEKMRQGWYFTGDVCIRNADATFDLIGRVDDAIRSGAEAIYPEEIETVLGLHPGVQEVCAVGIPDDLWGQMVVACVVRRKPDLTWQDLDGHCLASELANFKRPRAYLFVDALPRNATNKVVRQLVKDHAVSVATTSEALYRVAA